MKLWIGVALLLLGVLHSYSQECGNKPFSTIARVINGDDAQPHAWPWQISLRVNGTHVCGGSLISKDWVVTAAHCVYTNPSLSIYTVVVGAHNMTGTTSVQEMFGLKKLIIHEKWRRRHLRNDIALLQLNGSVTLTTKVNTICLPAQGDMVKAGTQCYITGWGYTRPVGNVTNTLQQAILPVATHKACKKKNGRQIFPVHKKTMICAGGNGTGGCQMDSGGPLACKEGGRWVLRGVASWAHILCLTDFFTVFARVSTFANWINQTTVTSTV